MKRFDLSGFLPGWISGLCSLGFLLLFFISNAFAGVPKLINFQGVLRDGSGNPVANNSYNVTFRIYNAPAGGTVLWSETQSVTTSSGLFSIFLGAVSPIPDSAFKDTSSYLGITVLPDPEMTPRQQLVSVGYGYRVSTVDGAAGGTISGDVNIAGKATIGFGHNNMGGYSFVAGAFNTARNSWSTVGGGAFNIAGDSLATVGGGGQDSATSYASTVGGGLNNAANGSYATVSGGIGNKVGGMAASAGGGWGNILSGNFSTITGGYFNRARGLLSVVSGGGGNFSPADSNAALADWSTVSGGRSNIAGGSFGAVAGGCGNKASGNFSNISGGLDNVASKQYATVGGGINNTANGNGSTIGGGIGNTANDTSAVVAGGQSNTSGLWATVGGGAGNEASGLFSTIAGGMSNIASGVWAAVSGGQLNRARGAFSVVSGGGEISSAFDSNAALGDWSVIPGGRANLAKGNYSFAAGRRAKSNHEGTFIWADATDANFTSTGANQFLIRATGGVGIGTGSPQGALDVSSTTGALIVPRMTDAQRDALTGVDGMIIYNTTTNQFNFFENGNWVTKVSKTIPVE